MSSDLRQPSIRRPFLVPPAGNPWLFGMVALASRLRLYLDRGETEPAAPIDFVVDTGASFCSMGVREAEARGIRVPPPGAEVPIRILTATGPTVVRYRPGRIRHWWNEDRSGYPFDWPILFGVDAPPTVPPILGLGGPLLTCRWTFDGTFAADAPFGSLLLDDTR